MEHRLKQVFRRIMRPKTVQFALPSLAQGASDGGARPDASLPPPDRLASTDTLPLLI